MENRFFEMTEYLEEISGDGNGGTMTRNRPEEKQEYGFSISSSFDWSGSLSAQNRVLVILIENGGVDLGIPDLVDKLLSNLHVSFIPDSAKQQIVSYIKDKIKTITDNLLETAELTVNRYSSSKPNLFGDVVVLRNGTGTYQQLKDTLTRLSRDQKIIDVFVLTHGGVNSIAATGGEEITGQMITDIKTSFGKPLSIRSVYMMNCKGSTLNKSWIDAGAKVSSGSIRNNYLPEPTMFFFWSNWKEGQNFETAVTGAYRKTINLMNDTVKTVLGKIPGLSSFAGSFNFENYDFVKDSAPVIQGQRSLTINSDDLTFTQSVYTSLATTVLPVDALDELDGARSFSTDKLPKPWKLSSQGVELIKKFEGYKSKLYNDPVGHCTVGYGTLVHHGNCNGDPSEQPYVNGVTQEQATELLTKEAAEFEKVINDAVTVDLNQNQFDSLVSFTYNVGGGNFRKSTLLKVLNQGNYDGVPSEIKKWTKGRVDGKLVDLPGLVSRRNAEANLFSGTAPSVAKSLSLSFSGFSSQFSGAVDYTIPGIVPEMTQPSDMTCWATVITMMLSWKKKQSFDIATALGMINNRYVKMFQEGQGLDSVTARQLYADADLIPVYSFNPTIQGWESFLKDFGPLYVDIGFPGINNTHAIIITSIKGDGSSENTNISYIDPARGRTITMKFKNFLAAYETPGAVSWPYTIVHWRTGAYSGAQSYYSVPFYDTGEHAIFGEFINNAVSGPIATVHALQPTTNYMINGVPFTYGQIITMGDFYDRFEDLQKGDPNELKRLKVLISRSENHYKNIILGIGGAAADVSDSEWGSKTVGIGDRYLDLALKNNSHFAPPPAGVSSSKQNNKQSWEMYHAQAIKVARAGTTSADLDKAMPINAFGDHFLTDAFSAGHLVNKEMVMNKFVNNVITNGKINSAGDKLFAQVAEASLADPEVKKKLGQWEVMETSLLIAFKHLNLDTTFPKKVFYEVLKGIMEDTAHGGREQIANLAAKAVHDFLNDYQNGSVKGVPVKNNKGMSWNLSGDGTLNWDRNSHINNLEIIQLAVKQSVQNVEDSVTNPNTPLTTFYQKVWDYVPILTEPTTRTVVDNAIATFTNPALPQLLKAATALVKKKLDILLHELEKAKLIRSVNTTVWG